MPIDKPIGVCVANLIDVKNQSLLLRALDEIRRRRLPLPHLAFVGDGPNRVRLEAEVRSWDWVITSYLLANDHTAEVAIWMGAADWLLLSSLHEGWPTVYFEAMACGRPVLTSNVSAAKDAIIKQDYGRIVEGATPDAFAQVMIEAASRQFNPDTIRAYAEQHSWERWAEQAMGVIESTVSSQHE